MKAYPRFYFPTNIYSGPQCCEHMRNFFSQQDVVFLMTDETLMRAGIVQNVQNAFQTAVGKIHIFDQVKPDPAVEMVIAAAREAHELHATAVVAVGGGSVMDAAKTVAMLLARFPNMEDYAMRRLAPVNASVPCYVVPTTCGTGAEASSAAVLSYSHVKMGIKAETMFPKAAFLDETLMLSLPKQITAHTAMDALTHSVESYIGLTRHPILDALNLQAVSLVFKYLRRAYSDGQDQQAKFGLTQAACMAGLAMGHSGTGLVHAFSSKMCEEYHHLSHGLSNAILLPYCVRYNAPAVLGRLNELATAIGLCGSSEEEGAYAFVAAVESLARDVGIPPRITGHVLTPERIRILAQETKEHFIAANNPRTPTIEELVDILVRVLPQEE